MMQITFNHSRSIGTCMIMLYTLGVMPLSLSKGCSGTEDKSKTVQTQSQLSSLDRAKEWLNSKPLNIQDLNGKVVLVEFCTYTCINWLRTLPYVRAWSEKYKNNGLVVIGVHTPEFAFESKIGNVRKAISDLNINFPVAIDNNHEIWNAFENQYWPALYFLDVNGTIRHYQFGEGDYEKSERVIQQLLIESGKGYPNQDLVAVKGAGIEAAADLFNLRSNENYLGYERTENFTSKVAETGHRLTYSFPQKLKLNQWAISGDWTIDKNSILLNGPGGKIVYRFHARDLHLVMGSVYPGSEVRFRVFIDGKIVAQDYGIDLDEKGNGIIRDQRLYQLIRQTGPIVDREVVIEFLDPGVEAFSFTFG